MMWQLGLRYVSAIIDRAGYVFLPKWHLTTAMHAQLLRDLFQRNRVDCIFDVGANRGQFRDFLRKDVGFTGLIFSFEPVRHLAEHLTLRSKEDGAWHVFQLALGETEQHAEINVTKADNLSSFLRPRLQDQPFEAETNVVRSEIVQIKPLSSVFSDLCRTYSFNSVFLKLDTQGFDLSVLKGANAALPSICAIQTELSLVPIYEGMPEWTVVITALKDRGFELASLFPVNLTRDGRVMEYDGVFVRALRGVSK